MASFGFLTLNLEQEKEYYINTAKFASSNGFEIYHFTPFNIDPHTEKVSGMKFNAERNDWENCHFEIPDFIYDRCFYKDKKQQQSAEPIVSWLKNKTEFIGHGLPDKWETYKLLTQDPTIKFYLPETEKIVSSKQVLPMLNKYKQIILKPINGSQGKGVIRLSLLKNNIELLTTRHKTVIRKIFLNKKDLLQWLDKLFAHHEFLLQPYLLLNNKKNQPYDLRILLQKDHEGLWSEKGRGLRIGKEEHLISNLHGGGSALPYHFIKKEFSSFEQSLIEDEINTIIKTLPPLLENSFGHLFELGIDIGIDQDNVVWLIDINSKPGHQVITLTKPTQAKDIYAAPIQYCLHLMSGMKKQ